MVKFKEKKLSLFAVLMLAGLFILVACGNGNGDEGTADDDTAAPENGGVSDRDELIIGFPSNPAQMDPHNANDVPSRQISSHIFETLIVMDENQNLTPGLATSWEPVSDNVWQFTIREDVYFHNGTPLTAYDVAFSISRVSASPILSPIFGMFDPDLIEVIDTHVVNIGTTDPFAPMLIHLAHHAAAILSEEAIGDTLPTETVLEQLVGTGPYTATEWVIDNYIVLERFDDFHGDAPNMRRIEFRIMPDPHARTVALETRAVDVIINIAPSDVANLTADPTINIQSAASTGIEYMGMNFAHPYLGIQEVRQAINYALDTETIVAISTEETALPLTTHVAPSVFGFSPDIEPIGLDLDRAQALMAEAGVEGFSFDLLINQGSAPRLAAAEMIQNQLQPLGITVSIQQLEWAAYLEARDYHNFDAFIGGWSNPSGDADNGLVPLLYTGIGDIQINSAELDDLLMQGRRAIDEDERLAIYHDVLQYLREAAPFVLLGNTIHFVATDEHVHGITVMPTNVQFYGNVYFVE
ncbi:MAG: ABC transporter substrate-binding protein [Turicibacter sp.]|nr:ABC transporter substrate-binding protein [Turicibacter sp.]